MIRACTLAHAVEPHITWFAVGFGIVGALFLGVAIGMFWQSRRDAGAFLAFIKRLDPRALVASFGGAA